MLEPRYPISTERLTLRPFTPDDLDAVHAYESLPEVARYLYWEPRDRDTARGFLDKKIARTALREEGDAIDLAITLTATGEVIGNTLLAWTSRRHRQGEIGYVLHPAHHRRGYAAEATREMLRLGFEQLGLHRIVGRLDARNTASASVLRKLGMRQEAHLVENEVVKGEWTSEIVYAVLAREWPAAPAPASVLHLALRSDWEAARPAGEYRVSTLGRTLEQEGFIHCSRDAAQLRTVHDTFYTAVTEPLVVLHIDTTGLDVRVEGGFPHLYGPLPAGAVTAVHPYPPEPGTA
uniref:GNAT family N-acetyltransferase n=1 Tax=Nonomuraea pusilla TaxID=46177 RepID=UPI0009EAAEA4